MSTALMLAFKTTDDKICNLRINKPRADVTRTEAEEVMSDIIDRDVFKTTSGASLSAISSVYTVVTTKTDILV